MNFGQLSPVKRQLLCPVYTISPTGIPDKAGFSTTVWTGSVQPSGEGPHSSG